MTRGSETRQAGLKPAPTPARRETESTCHLFRSQWTYSVETIWKKAEPGSIMVVEGTMDKTRTCDLVEKAQAGDRDSYGQLVDRYGAVVLAIAYSRTGNGAIAQDIAQDAFLIGFENISSLRQPARFGAWLRGITTNLCKKWYQSQTYRRRLEEDSVALGERLGYVQSPGADEKLERIEMQNLIDQSLENLSVSDRESLILYYFEGKSVAEAARALDISTAAMKKRLERARNRLRDQVAVQIETGLTEAAKRSKISQRVLAAIPLGASYAKIASVASVLPTLPALEIAAVTAKIGGIAMVYGKAATVIFGLCIAGGAYLTFGERQQNEPPELPAQGDLSVMKQAVQEPPEAGEPASVSTNERESDAMVKARPPFISGTVRDGEGNPLPGALVEARLERPLFEEFEPALVAAKTETAADGSYVLASLPPRKEMLIFVTHPDWASGGKRVEPLKEGEQKVGVDFSLSQPEHASGAVIDEAGRPIEGAVVTVDTAFHSAYYNPQGRARADAEGLTKVSARWYGKLARAVTNSEGRFTLTHLPKDSVIWTVTAAKAGYARNWAWNNKSCEKAERLFISNTTSPWLGREFPVPCDNIKIVLQKGGAITGRVVNSETGRAVEDVLISLQGIVHAPQPYNLPSWSFTMSARSDTRGSYRINDVPAISVMVKAQKGTLVGDSREVPVRSGEISEGIDFNLVAVGAIEGTVYDAESGRPIPGQIVRCFKTGIWGPGGGGRTDANGRYRAGGLEPGEWETGPDFSNQWRLARSHHPDTGERRGVTMTVRAGQVTSGVDLYFEKVIEGIGNIGGKVTDIAHTSIAGATVVVREGARRAVSDEQGEYSIVRLEAGLHELIALDRKSGTYGTAIVNLKANEEAVVNIEVKDKAASINGTVLDNEGRPLETPVGLQIEGSGLKFRPEIDDTGVYSSGPIPPGIYSVQAWAKEGYKIEPREPYHIEVGERDQLDSVNFVLTPMTGFVAGTVLYPDGRPVAGKRVCVGGSDGLGRSITDANGRFRAEKVDGDDLYVQVGQPSLFDQQGDPEWLFIRGIPAGTDNLKLVLKPVGILTGRVPIAGDETDRLSITVRGDVGFDFPQSAQSQDGVFNLSLQPDTYRVTISNRTGSCTIPTVVVEPNMTTDLGDIELSPAASGK